ncbi:MAG: hypothetical protein LLG20_24575 [Acidobacteriales bacterium]|nr:hypothetical protein [Terriglobales bacterium]
MRSRKIYLLALALASCLAGVAPVFAQEPDSEGSSNTGWRKVGDPAPETQANRPAPAAVPALPPQLVLPAGTFVMVRVDQPLSSDHNYAGDAFSATLAQPLIANGYVVARRGQTVAGRVAEAQKAGRVRGQSRLGVELTELTLVDGQQMPIQTQLIQYSGGTTRGRDATAIAATSGTGAAIGAIAEGGAEAGIGAAAGAAAAVIGVLVTRGRATEIYPEATLTFRIMQPLTIDTESSALAFRPVTQQDYETRMVERRPTLYRRAPGYYYGYGYPYMYPYPYFYSPFYYGYGWGPSFHFYSGRHFYGHGGHGRR